MSVKAVWDPAHYGMSVSEQLNAPISAEVKKQRMADENKVRREKDFPFVTAQLKERIDCAKEFPICFKRQDEISIHTRDIEMYYAWAASFGYRLTIHSYESGSNKGTAVIRSIGYMS